MSIHDDAIIDKENFSNSELTNALKSYILSKNK